MRASTECSSIIPVVVVELGARDSKVLGTWSADTEGANFVQSFLSVFGLANDQTTNNLGVPMPHVIISARHLHTDFKVVSSLEVVPFDGTSTLNNCTITLVLVRHKVLVRHEVLVLGRNRWVVVGGISSIVVDWVALPRAREVVVEYSETVATIRMGNVVIKLAKLLVLRANVCIERRSNGGSLKNEPV